MAISTDIGVWLSVTFVFMMVTVLWRENPLYRFAEHTYIAAHIGYMGALAYKTIVVRQITPLSQGKIWAIIPMIVGAMVFGTFHRKFRWTARIPLSILVATGIGLTLSRVVPAMVLPQLRAAFVPVWTATPENTLMNLLSIIITVSGIFYFLYTLQYKGTAKRVADTLSKIGRLGFMATFGAAFVMNMYSQLAIFLGVLDVIFSKLLGLY